MLDYARRMKLALSDAARRIGQKAGAGVVVVIGAGFLLAALWTYLADYLHWGSMLASLTIGAVFVILGLLVLVLGGRARHRPPTTAELRDEFQERLSIATDVVLDRVTGRAERAIDKVRDTAGDALETVQSRASEFADLAGNKVQSLVDTVSYRAHRAADSAEARVQGFVRTADETAEKLGLTPERKEKLAEGIDKAKSSNLAALAPAVGAFALGLTLASRLQSWRHREDDGDDQDDGLIDDDEDWDEEDWDEDWSDENWPEGR